MKSQNALLQIIELDAVDHNTEKWIVNCVDLDFSQTEKVQAHQNI